MRRLAALAALAMVVLAGACSGGDDDAASTSTRNTTSTTVAATTTTSTTGTSTTGAPRQASVGDLVLDPDHDYGNQGGQDQKRERVLHARGRLVGRHEPEFCPLLRG